MRLLIYLALILLVVPVGALIKPDASNKPDNQFVSYIQAETKKFANCIDKLSVAANQIDPSKPETIQLAVQALRKSRLQYKKISFFLDYFFPNAGKLYNSPPKREIEEPFIEFEEPTGLQVVESILFDKHPEKNIGYLRDELTVIRESAHDLDALCYDFAGNTSQILESVRLELIRIMTLYITGYDSPDLKSGVAESAMALESIRVVLTKSVFEEKDKDDFVVQRIDQTLAFLQKQVDFDRFDRLRFLTDYALPLEESLGEYIRKSGQSSNKNTGLDFSIGNLFQHEVRIVGQPGTDKMILLGRKLFFDQILSFNKVRSCSSCHQPGRYFSDGMTRNHTLSGQGFLRRNTPTILYSCYQSTQFWDGRVKTIADQIGDVLLNPDEMHGSVGDIEKKLNADSIYVTEFFDAFPDSDKTSGISFGKIKSALASYINTLAPMSSAFDRYMSGDKKALNEIQKRGFNLFMGKARCGTCHFAPIFNGSTPPFYNRTEYEVLGVPASYNAEKKQLDTDEGRFGLYPIPDYKRAFKTPTVRNTEKTAPYMHNGSFKNLDDVMEFYNLGGGKGIGLKVPDQSLSEKKLRLTNSEMHAIVSFLHALTDSLQ